VREIEHPEQQGWEGDARFTHCTGWPETRQSTFQTPEIGNGQVPGRGVTGDLSG
jgi:hypothetical protein